MVYKKYWYLSCMLPLFFSGLLLYLVGMNRRTSSVSYARETTLTFFIMYLSPLMSEVYLLFNLLKNLSIMPFGIFPVQDF